MMNDPICTGYTVFCDDIRLENSGKYIFIGVYEGAMVVHGDFPFLLPKFAMAVRYLERIGSFSEEVILRVFIPGDDPNKPSIEGGLNAVAGRKAAVPHSDSEPSVARYVRIGSDVVLSPLIIPKAGEILVRVHCGSHITKLGALLVTNSRPE